MNHSNFDEKIEQYEKTAVDVANNVHNDFLRSENSKKVITNFPNVRLASENKTKTQKGVASLLSALFLGTSLITGGYAINQHSERKNIEQQLGRTESKIETLSQQFSEKNTENTELSRQLASAKYNLEQEINLGSKNYERLLREVVSKELNSYTYPLHLQFSDKNSYTKIVSRMVLGRDSTQEEFGIVLDEIRKAKQEFYDNGGIRK